MLWNALTLQLGYNATLVTIGATLLGIAAGVTGTFLYLRKRALVSDAISHATLPGVGIAFMLMVLLGGDGRTCDFVDAASVRSRQWLVPFRRIGNRARELHCSRRALDRVNDTTRTGDVE